MTAGQQFDFEQVVVRAAAEQPIPQPRFLASRSRPVVHSRFIRFAVADEVVHQFSFGLLRPVLGQSPVDFTDFAVFDQFVHTRQRLAGLGEKHGSADRTVDAVHDAEEHVARFVVAHVDERFDFVFEGRIAGRVGCTNSPERLLTTIRWLSSYRMNSGLNMVRVEMIIPVRM